MELIKTLESLVKTLEAGSYAGTSPDRLVQGSALAIEDLSPVMQNVCIDDSHIKLQKLFNIKKSKSLLQQFNRKLSYGRLGGSAQREGAVGDLKVSDYIRATVPMCFYSHVRRITLPATLVDTFDGKDNEQREAEDAAMILACDIEFDMFKGKADFSNAGVFDGNPLAIPELPNMLGCDAQIRQSDVLLNTQDLMFYSYGSNQSVIQPRNGALNQSAIEDAHLRMRMNHGKGNKMYVDPVILSGYNKQVALGTGSNSIQRIQLAGSAQDASGADLRRQWVSGGTVSLEDSRFLSGKTSPLRPNAGSPAAPTSVAAAVNVGAGALAASAGYFYLVTGENERGEGEFASDTSAAVASGDSVTLTITATNASFFNVYRGSSASNAKFIGRVKYSGSATTLFEDLGNKAPGFVTGYLLQEDCWGIHELSPYSRLKLAISDLSTPEAHFRFLTLAGYQPRKNVIMDNLF